MATSFQKHYKETVVPALKKEFGYTNALQVPRVTKVLVNVGISAKSKDAKVLEGAQATLERITGQKPSQTQAKKSISNFKVRQGMTVGLLVTLRGVRMEDFLDRLIHLTLPRVRDFRGLSEKTIDARGSLSIGFREHVAFPEVHSDEVERLHGLGVTVVTNAKSRKEGAALLKHLGFPFREGK